MLASPGRRLLQVRGRQKILLAGFKPYGGESINASQMLIRVLKRAPLARKWVGSVQFAILPADPMGLQASLFTLLQRHDPDYVLMVGQAPGRTRICLEQAARNSFQGQRICTDGPPIIRATLTSQTRIINVLRRAIIPAAISNDAGDYLCNLALYLTLAYRRKQGEPFQAGFVHIPVLPIQAAFHGQQVPVMRLDVMRRALWLILSVLIAKPLRTQGGPVPCARRPV